jgi:hypothetical protein
VVKFFTETGLLALCSNPQPGGIAILVAFYDMHGLQWDYSFPRSPHGDLEQRINIKFCVELEENASDICAVLSEAYGEDTV